MRGFSIELILIIVLSQQLFKLSVLSPHIYRILLILTTVLVILRLLSRGLLLPLLGRGSPLLIQLMLSLQLLGLLMLPLSFHGLQVLLLLIVIAAVRLAQPQHWLLLLLHLGWWFLYGCIDKGLGWLGGWLWLSCLLFFDGHVCGLALA